MSCRKNRNDMNKKPAITDTMKNKKQVYVWRTIKNNPNLYCWVPTSGKNVNFSNVSIDKIKIQDIPPAPIPNNYEERVRDLMSKAETIKEKKLLKSLRAGVDKISSDDPKKYKIVKQFIIDNELKLYGGAAINLYLPKQEKIYKSSVIPDYDFFSSNPWKDAVKLANILYDHGYEYTEVRSGIHKGTYKVFSDFWPVADITYMVKEDFDRLETRTIQGVKVVNSGQLIGDMYIQLIVPMGDLSRWEKVSKRQKLLEKWGKPFGRRFNCTEDIFIQEQLPATLIELLELSDKFCKEKKLIYIGTVAYNTYVELGGGKQRAMTDHFELLSEQADQDIQELYEKLVLHFNGDMEIETRHITWQPINNTYYSIKADINGIIWEVCRICQLTICTSYKYLLGKYIASIDYVKMQLYFEMSFGETKEEVKDSKCKILYITEIQNKYYISKKISELDPGPFQRFVTHCKGPSKDTLKGEIFRRWINNVETRKKIRTIKAKQDTITLQNVKGSVIRIFPKEPIPNECVDKTEIDCNYPCSWNEKYNRCFGIPIGVYRVGIEDIIELDDEAGVGIYDMEGGAYPVYG